MSSKLNFGVTITISSGGKLLQHKAQNLTNLKRYPFVTRVFPNLSSKMEELTYRFNQIRLKMEKKEESEIDLTGCESTDTLKLRVLTLF